MKFGALIEQKMLYKMRLRSFLTDVAFKDKPKGIYWSRVDFEFDHENNV